MLIVLFLVLSKMSTLGDITRIAYQISSSKLKAVTALHIICFGNDGQPRKIRKNVRLFAGFNFEKGSNEHVKRLDEVKNKLDLPDLIAVCNMLGLDYSNVDDVADRICSFLIDLKTEDVINNDDTEDEEQDSEDENEATGQAQDACLEEVSSVEMLRNNVNVGLKDNNSRRRESFALTFRDVEDSIRPFDGKDDYPIRSWIRDFEEMAEVTGWNDLQKLLFAKKSLRGLAKLFSQSEKGIKTWSVLKKRLIDEFDTKINAAQIHKMLMMRKKKSDETVQEYVLIMREIGSRADVEPETIIQYIIDGISDEVPNKLILYGARNFLEFKDKVKLYDQMQKKRVSTFTYKRREEVKKEVEVGKDVVTTRKRESDEKQFNCFNCGRKGHKSRHCPDKSKGTKCFSCGKYGHLSTGCPSRESLSKETKTSNVNVVEAVPKNAVKLKINETQLIALFDTGSDINTIREDVYDGYFRDIPLSNESITIKGLGESNVTKTIGSFVNHVLVNEDEFSLTFHVIPKSCTAYKAIVGNSLLDQANVSMTEGEIVVYKKEKDNFLMKINVEAGVNEINVEHISNSDHRNAVEDLMRNYVLEKKKTTEIEMKIIIKNEEPIYQRSRRLSVPEKIEVERQVSEWLRDGIVKPSSSEFASLIVLVPKKDGTIRVCCDFRKINKQIVKDRFPLPLIEDVLDGLQDAKVFSTIDLKNGFFHVPIEGNSTKYTSFVTHNGQYEFLRCPFGLCNSPAVFQRFIAHIFRPLTEKGVAIYYMDDVIIPSRDEVEGIRRLKLVLDCARDYGLQIRMGKCQLLKRKVEFLGFIIKDGSVQPSDGKTIAIRKFPEPKTYKQLQSFLGLTGYFRKFIAGYATIAKPLSDLLRKDTPFVFHDVQRTAFTKLKDLLTNEPVLHIYQQGREVELHTDASQAGYGACLMQKGDDSKLHPIYYMSKKTTPVEEKYSSYELEVLAIIQAIKKFRVYLLGIKFKIVTDCAVFQRTMDEKDLTTRVARWALLLEEYDYEIVHRRGVLMPHVDALSRNPVVMTITEEDGIIKRLQNAQRQDKHVEAIRKILQTEEYDDYFLKHDILYKYENGKELFVVPRAMQAEIIKKAHEVGHFSVNKTEEIVKREFYIAKLREKIKSCTENCIPCILGSKKEGRKEGFLHPLPKGETPLETYHADHLGPIPSTNKNYQYILAVIDDFTNFAWLYPTRSTTSKETVVCLKKQQSVFGNPSKIITDKGTAFTAGEFEDYCKEEGIIHVTITTGVPRGNGQIERIHRIVIPVLTKLSLDDPTKWYKHLDKVQRALNSTYQRSVATTPFEVLIGVRMRNKEDIAVKEAVEKEYIEQVTKNREELRKECKAQILKVQEENRKGYNLR